jgi:DNA/RNA endonuclease YhcR with UshA esterase domain
MALKNEGSNQMVRTEGAKVSHVRRRILTFACLGLVFALTGTLTVAAPVDGVIPIAKARSLPLGTHVTISGVVSTPAGAFESSFYDKGFGLQDGSAGIYISTPTVFNMAKPPKRAYVTGVLKDQSGLLVVVPADTAAVQFAIGLMNAAEARVIEPKPLKTSEVGEANEGWIVQVHGKITQAPTSDAPYGFKVSIDDGSGEALIFVNVQTGIPMSSFVAGKVVSVTGFSSQYDTHHEIDPRGLADIGAAKP